MRTILQHTLLLNLLLCCWSIPNAFSNTPTDERCYSEVSTEHAERIKTSTQMSALPELSSPTDQATNVSLTPNLQWTGTGSSYTVEVYNCSPDYTKVGQLHLSDFSVDIINTNIANVSDDFSGATYNSTTNSSFYVINGGDAFGAERVVELDNNGVWQRAIELDGFDDTEGIVWIGGNEYLILEEKNARVIKVSINSGTMSITYPNNYIQLLINDCDNGDCVEGISYNPFTNEVILANEIEPKPEIYVFTLPPTISGVVNITPTQPFDAEMELLVDDLAGLHHLSLTEGLANMNVNSHFLALSEQSKVLIETDMEGNIYGSLDLSAGNAGLSTSLNQPEGVTMDNQGNIYIASEKDDFYKFTNQTLDLNPFGLAPGTIHANTNVTTNSLSIPAGVLTASTEYCWRVKDNATGAWSDYHSFTTEMIDCSTDRDALIALYNATNGPAWDEDNAGGRWNLNQPMSSWYGVTLDANGCVIGLEMLDNDLDGVLPPELGNLGQLEILDLGYNHNLVGPIPPEFGQMASLKKLDLRANYHNGPIPPELGQLYNLEELNLRTNELTGPIPPELGDLPNLQILNLSMNQLTGPIPPTLANLPNSVFRHSDTNEPTASMSSASSNSGNLSYLNLRSNQLSGCYDQELSELCNSLDPTYNTNYYISDGNNFDLLWESFCSSGTACVVPCDTIPQRNALIALYNATDGANWYSTWNLNQSMSTWSGVILNQNGCVDILALANNNLNGTLPAELGDLTSLTQAYFNNNNLTGEIPVSLANLTDLYLTVSNNQLTGCYAGFEAFCSSWSNHHISDGNDFSVLWETFCFTQDCTPSACSIGDRDALIAIYNAAGGANSDLSWDLSQPMSTWQGVTLDIYGCVIELDLAFKNLSGTLAPEIGDLSNLTLLDMSYNQLTGDIPSSVGNLTNLTSLELNNNQLTGNIPSALGNLPNISTIILQNNQLSGEIPATFGDAPALFVLSLFNNQLSGCYDDNLMILCQQLSYSYNRNSKISYGNYFNVEWESFCATGSCVPNACVAPERDALIAIYNAFGGANTSLSWDLSRPTNTWQGVGFNIDGCVISLDLENKNLTGTIPPEIADLSSLITLRLGDNQLIGNIPAFMANMTNLINLSLRDNQLTGNIPAFISNMTNLFSLKLNGNQFTGTIPPELGNLSGLTTMYLNDNQLTGEIPATFSNISGLQYLFLYNNQLSGCYDNSLAALCGQLFFSDNNNFISDGNNFAADWDSFCSTGSGSCCSVNDYAAMVAFANSITSWGSTSPWNVTQPLDTWDGVALHPDGCVKAINLDENYTAGTIPPELGNLSSIETLDLGDNNFSGTIPSELGNLSTLTYLNLDGNALTGSIPAEFSNLTSLLSLYLSYNQLSGSIPPELGNLTELSRLSLKSNNLTGNIPSELGNMTKLNFLSLNNNQLTGPIPSTFGNLSFLGYLGLYNNQLSGCYDNQLLNLCGQLNPYTNTNTYISNGNNFNLPWEDFCNSGTGACVPINCPNQQDQYTALRAFYLSTDGDNWGDNDNWPNAAFFNANPNLPAGMIVASWYGIDVNTDGCVTRMDFDEDNIDGTIPPELGNLTDLEYLDLGSNRFSGSLPAEMGNLSSLTYMNLSNNSSLTGNIPPELGNLGLLETIYFNFNNFSGSIPPELGNLTNLSTLSIRRNQLSGNIPDELGNLTNLTYLGLDDNQLTGTIPASLGNITSLTSLGLKNNQLSGCYDPALQNLCSQLISYYNSNAQISAGNNFDALWEDFCNSGTGECLPVCTPDYNAMVAFHNAITDWGLMTPWDLTQPMGTWEGVVLNAAGCVEEITIDEEYVTGVLPSELGNLSSLTKLDLGSNNFAGSIPPELGNLSNLTYLNLSDNNLTGSIPPDLGNLSSLTVMYMTYNQLSGSIPPGLGNLSNLSTLSLGTNQLSGNIPPELGNLSNLTSLTLRANQFTGSIPATFGNMPNLTSLSLYDNQLSGCYDSNLTALCGQLFAYFNSNTQISNGNNFNAAWEDFCTNATAVCDLCPTDLNLSNPLSTGTYQASQTLSSESTVPTGTDVQFKAGDEILLDKGFSVEPGSNFSGEVGEDCNDN